MKSRSQYGMPFALFRVEGRPDAALPSVNLPGGRHLCDCRQRLRIHSEAEDSIKDHPCVQIDDNAPVHSHPYSCLHA